MHSSHSSLQCSARGKTLETKARFRNSPRLAREERSTAVIRCWKTFFDILKRTALTDCCFERKELQKTKHTELVRVARLTKEDELRPVHF